jgi:outer membrane lipoprotein carrier protein
MSLPGRCHFFLLLCLLPSMAQSAAIDSLKTFIHGTRTVRATFSQTLLDKNMRVMQKASGTMQFERPGRFRWTYEKPYEQLIVGDGVKVWFYDRDLSQVTVRKLDLAIGSSPAALLAGSSAIESNFDLGESGLQGGLEWLEARPKTKEGTFELVRLGFTLEGTLTAMELHDNFGQTTVLIFSGLEKNPRLAPGLFKFTPPESADVISD